jgi:heme O synthase-like polyprenyltransferase
MPTMVGTLGFLYFVGALILSLALLHLAVRFYHDHGNAAARRLFSGSPLYLSLLIGLMILDRVVG